MHDVNGSLAWWMRNVEFLPHGRFHDATGGTVKASFDHVADAMSAAFTVNQLP